MLDANPLVAGSSPAGVTIFSGGAAMGEMADLVLDDMMFNNDCMGPDISGVNCQYCKRGPYYWMQDHLGHWRLYTENEKLHICKPYKLEKK